MVESEMDVSTLAKALAALIRVLGAHAAPDALKQCLVKLCEVAAQGDAAFTVHGGTLCVNEQAIADGGHEVAPLIEAMERHGVALVSIEATAAAKELLLLANLLSESPEGPSARTDLRAHALGCWHVRLVLQTDRTSSLDEDVTTVQSSRPTVSGALACATADDAYTFAEGLTEQLQLYASEMDAEQVTLLLLDVLRTERHCEALGDSADDFRIVWTATFDQLASPSILQLVAQLLTSSAVSRADVLAVLQRSGESGVGTLISRLIKETDRSARRALFDAIVEMRTGIPLLLRNLSHSTWYVVRNAVSVLGAMGAKDCEAGLAQTLGHADERVRLATVTALRRIATPAAIAALSGAMRDRSAAVRHRAFKNLRELASGNINATALGDALELERDESMQRALLDAMVATRSADAVQRLAKLCSPSARGAYSGSLRIAMLEGLLALRPSTAMPLLRMAAEDRDLSLRTRARELMAKPVAVPA